MGGLLGESVGFRERQQGVGEAGRGASTVVMERVFGEGDSGGELGERVLRKK